MAEAIAPPKPARAPSKQRAPEGKSTRDAAKEKAPQSTEAVDKAKAIDLVDEKVVKEAGEVAGNATDTAGKGNPDIAREALFQTASLGETRVIQTEINALLEKKQARGELTKDETKKIKILEKQLKKTQRVEAQVGVRAEQLQINGGTPEAKALGYDLTIGLEQRSIAELSAHLNTQKAKLGAKDLDPLERASIEEGVKVVEESIQTKSEKIKTLREERKALGEEIPNQLTEAAELILGKKLDAEQAENPLATMEQTLKTIISSENPLLHKAFASSLEKSGIVTSPEQWKELTSLMDGENLNDKDVDLKHLAMKAGGGLLMMLLIMIYVASKGSVGGGGGVHPGMG